MKALRYAFAALVVAMFSGCAHQIAIKPDIAKIEREAGVQAIQKNAGYYISDANRTLTVTTPGGGGDKVAYFPYRDVEPAFYKMLSNVFKDVTLLKAPSDTETISKQGISYVFTPLLVTDSSSSSAFTWPPTNFTVQLTCDITDAGGKVIATKSVTGNGHAEFSEFKSDFSLSAKRATQDALLKMQQILLAAPELKS